MPRLLILLLSLVAIIVAPNRALAQDGVATPPATPVPNRFEIGPEAGEDPATTAQGFFVYELAPGAEATGSVRVNNPGAESVTVELAAADANTAQSGGSAFAGVDATPTASGRWLRLDEPRVTLAPGEAASVGFSVQPPAQTAPGQYLAGLVAYIPAAQAGASGAGADQAGASVTMQTRYVIGVQVDVPGEWTPSLEITGASAMEQPSGTRLGIAIENNGDEFLKPEGSVTLSNADLTPILTEPIKLGTFLTGTDITYPVAWPGAPNAGEYGVEVELTYANDKVARYSGQLSVSDNAPVAAPPPGSQPAATAPAVAPAAAAIPMWVFAAIAALLGLIVLLLIMVLARSRKPRW